MADSRNGVGQENSKNHRKNCAFHNSSTSATVVSSNTLDIVAHNKCQTATCHAKHRPAPALGGRYYGLNLGGKGRMRLSSHEVLTPLKGMCCNFGWVGR